MSIMRRRALRAVLIAAVALAAHAALRITLGPVFIAPLPLFLLFWPLVLSANIPDDDDERARLIGLRATQHAASTAMALPLINGLAFWIGRARRGCETIDLDTVPLIGAVACVTFLIARLYMVIKLENDGVDVAEP